MLSNCVMGWSSVPASGATTPRCTLALMRQSAWLEHDAQISERAAAMLEKLGTEVDRLRQSIGCFGYGRLSHREISELVETWNDSPKPHAKPA